MTDINQKLKLARLKLFSNDLIFFGLCLYKFNWVIEDLNNDYVIGYVDFDEKDLSKVKYGNIYLNTRFLNLSEFTFNHTSYVLCHELLHILDKHAQREEDRIHELWAVACDHVIECKLKTLSNVIKPFKNHYNIIDKLEHELPNCTAEEAYDWLLTNRNKFTISSDKDQKIIKLEDSTTKKTIIIHDTLKINQLKEKNINQFITEARSIFEQLNLKNRGLNSGKMVEFISQILEIKLPWDRILEKAIKSIALSKTDDRSWRIPNKYYIPHNIILPSLFEGESESLNKLILCIDSSASISTADLQKFSGVIINSTKYFDNIQILVHDTEIEQNLSFKTQDYHEEEFKNTIIKQGFKGRGGTSHKEVFELIEDQFKSNIDELSLIILLTDGYSDIESIYHRYKWTKTIPSIFMITKHGYIPSVLTKNEKSLCIRI